MNENREAARNLLRKSKDDFYAAEVLSANLTVSLWIVGFHAQQSVEKALKAVLLFMTFRIHLRMIVQPCLICSRNTTRQYRLMRMYGPP